MFVGRAASPFAAVRLPSARESVPFALVSRSFRSAGRGLPALPAAGKCGCFDFTLYQSGSRNSVSVPGEKMPLPMLHASTAAERMRGQDEATGFLEPLYMVYGAFLLVFCSADLADFADFARESGTRGGPGVGAPPKLLRGSAAPRDLFLVRSGSYGWEVLS